MFKYLAILLFLCLLSCKSANHRSLDITEQSQSSIPIEKKDSVKEVKRISQLTAEEIQELADGSRIGPMTIYNTKDALEVTSEGELTNSLLGEDYSISGLQQHYNQVFNDNRQEIKDEESGEIQIINKLFFKESFVKVYYNPIKKQDDIVSGKIVNKELFMVKNIQLGISKKDFFDKIFKDASTFDFSTIDIFRNSDLMGDILQEFIFKADTLNQVILTSNYDWIPFEL